MHQFKSGPGQRKNFIISVGMAAIMAVPMFTQPLGLALASTSSAANASGVQIPARYEIEARNPLLPGDLEISLNRTLTETGGFVTRHEASRSVALTLATPVTAVSPYTVYLTRSEVNFRSGPGTSYSIIGILDMGQKMTVTGETADWKRVQDASGRIGYVWDDFLSRSMVFVSANDTVYLVKSGVNLRQAPTTESASLGLLSAGTRLTRTGIGDGWTRVRTASGTVGYVASYFLSTSAPVTVNPVITKVVDTAYSMLGVPYVYGSEDRSGVDCSGLILYCYQQAGVYVPRTSASYASFGSAVSYANMKPGDVIAMDTRLSDGVTSINHVGLYVGGGYMIHASSSNGKVVKASVANYLNYARLITIRRIVS